MNNIKIGDYIILTKPYLGNPEIPIGEIVKVRGCRHYNPVGVEVIYKGLLLAYPYDYIRVVTKLRNPEYFI
jgi:hypothetical protein